MTEQSVMVVQEGESFLKTTVELKKLLAAVSKESKKAIATLVKLLDSTEEKVRMQAATKLLDYQVEIADKIALDQLNRLVAEYRLKQQQTPKLVELPGGGSGKPERPLVDFGTIQNLD